MPEITIVGAGATGCTLALLLARYGIASTVIERRSSSLNHPAAHVINARSQEIWRRASPKLAAQIAALAPPSEEVSIIRWSTDLRGTPLGEIDLLSDSEQVDRIQGHSPFLISHIGQHLLMPILWDALEQEPLIDFRRGWSFQDVIVDGPRVTVHASGPQATDTEIVSRYVIGADGANSRVRDALGIQMRGPVLANMGSVFFHAELFGDTSRPLLTWIYSPSFCGVLIAHANNDYVLMSPYLSKRQDIAANSRSYWARVLPQVIGEGVAFNIHSTGTWTMTSQTAENFAVDNVILAGVMQRTGSRTPAGSVSTVACKTHTTLPGSWLVSWRDAPPRRCWQPTRVSGARSWSDLQPRVWPTTSASTRRWRALV